MGHFHTEIDHGAFSKNKTVGSRGSNDNIAATQTNFLLFFPVFG